MLSSRNLAVQALANKFGGLNHQTSLDEHGDEYHTVTGEWLTGTFCGRSFTNTTLDYAIDDMCTYINNHRGHDSMVGRIVDTSGWPNMKMVEAYLTNERHPEKEDQA